MKSMNLGLGLLVGLMALGGSLRQGEQEAEAITQREGVSLFENHRMRVIFYGVLEGLYEDGVSTEDARHILGEGAGPLTATNFVPGCPVCVPAVEALRVYIGRPKFTSYKGQPDTFGRGLKEAMQARLRHSEMRERFNAVQQLIAGWVQRRLDLMRLTPKERADYQNDFMLGRKIGMMSLNVMRESAAAGGTESVPWGDIGECAACNAAVEAAEKKR